MNLINSLKKVRQLKSVFILSSALVVSLSTVSCKDNDDRYVTPDITISSEVVDNTILFEKTGGEKSFGVSSNRPWKVEVNADWISVSPTSGNEGDTRITVKTLDNSNGIGREANIKIFTSTVSKNVVVKQAGSNGFESVTIIDENFNSGLGCWTSLAVTEGASWKTGDFNKDGYIKVSAHGSGKEKYETMLVSPAIEFKTGTNLKFQYKAYYAIAGTKLQVVLLDEAKKVIGEPLKTIDPSTPAQGFDKQYKDVEVDIPLTANAKYIALYYVGTKEFTTGFQIDNVKLVGGEGSVPVNCNGGDPAPSGDVTIVDDNFNSGLGCWTVASLTEKASWEFGEYKNDGYVKVSAHNSGKAEYKTMLVSPVIDFKTETNLTFQYKAYYAIAGTKLHVVLLDGAKKVIGDPLKTIDPSTPAKGFDKQYNNVAVTIPLTSNAKHIALYYVGTDKFTTGFQVDNVKLVGGTGSVPVNCNGGEPTPTPTPTPSGDAVDNFNVNFEGLAKNTLPQGWTNVNKEGTKTWRVGTYSGNSYVQMTSHNSEGADKVMLVSPKVKVEKDATLSFKMKVRYPVAGTILKVLLLDEGKNQVKEVKSYDLSAEHEFEPQSFEIKVNNKVKYVAFLYEGDNTKTSTVQLDDIVLAPKGGGVTPTPTPTPDPTPSVGGADIFIHAYSEGKSFEKYIVLYNPTDKEVDLSAYKLSCDQWTSSGKPNGAVSSALSGKIPAKGFKVFSHSSAKSYTGETDKSANSIFQFNGDDAVALLKSDDSVVDVFGPYLKNQRWLDGSKGVAADKTFIRKSSVTKPAKEYNADEWDIVDMNDFSRFTKR